jgi:hypothetical protein
MEYARARGNRYLSATYRTPAKRILGKTLWDGIAWAYDVNYGRGFDVGSESTYPLLLVR